MRGFILTLLCILLAALCYFELQLRHAEPALNQNQDFEMTEYEIYDQDANGYFGKADESKNIYIPRKHPFLPEGLQVEDEIIVYFNGDTKRDGPVKIEKKQ